MPTMREATSTAGSRRHEDLDRGVRRRRRKRSSPNSGLPAPLPCSSPPTRKAPRWTARCGSRGARGRGDQHRLLHHRASPRRRSGCRRHHQERTARHAHGRLCRSRACRATWRTRSRAKTRSTSPRPRSRKSPPRTGTTAPSTSRRRAFRSRTPRRHRRANVIPGTLAGGLQLPLSRPRARRSRCGTRVQIVDRHDSTSTDWTAHGKHLPHRRGRLIETLPRASARSPE